MRRLYALQTVALLIPLVILALIVEFTAHLAFLLLAQVLIFFLLFLCLG